MSGRNVNELIYAACILSAYPLSKMMFSISSFTPTKVKHLLSIFISLMFCYICFDIPSILHILFISLFSFYFARYAPIHWHPDWIIFAVNMSYLSALHIIRMVNHYMVWTIEATGVIMLLVIKCTTFTFDTLDKRKNAVIARGADDADDDDPVLLEWLGYVFFFPSFLSGPTIGFDTYKTWAASGKSGSNDAHLASGSFRLALWILPLLFTQRYFSIEYVYSEAFWDRSWIYKFIFCYLTMFIIRCKYYFAWCLAEANCLACGLSQKDSINVNIYNVELGQSPHEVLSNWNICTANWLKEYVYLRLVNKHGVSKSIATYFTNIVAASWHGFYPGYYLTFISGGMISEVAKHVRHNVRPLFTKNVVFKFFYDCMCTVNMWIIIMYFAIPFQIYGFYESLHAWKNVYFVGHIVMLLGMGLGVRLKT
jgi:lysophospholipid acyltransferase